MNSFKNNISSILALVIVVLCFLVIFVGIKSNICSENKDVVMLILGGIMATLTTIVGYFFGSSQSSAIKNETISKTINKELNKK